MQEIKGLAKGGENQPIRLPGLKPGVCSGLILSGALYLDLKSGFGAVECIKMSPFYAEGNRIIGLCNFEVFTYKSSVTNVFYN